MKMRSAFYRTFKQFMKTTTLHGFKYLCSPANLDRVVWLVCCCASACCAGLLCTVLWARFQQIPALLAVCPPQDVPAPLVAICPTPQRYAQLFAQRFLSTTNHTVYLPELFKQLLTNKYIPKSSLMFLEHVLSENDLSLKDALISVAPSCKEMMKKCRWRNMMVPCEQLFEKTPTVWGVCCIATAERLKAHEILEPFPSDQKLDLLLRCTDGVTLNNGCEFFTRYPNEEWINSITLTRGHLYKAEVAFQKVQDSHRDQIIDGNCISDDVYSASHCMTQCKERKCGCSDPIRQVKSYEKLVPPPCPVSRLNCLRQFKLRDDSCTCPPSCTRLTVDATSLEPSVLTEVSHTIDPIFKKANITTDNLLSITFMDSVSKVFELMYTETWWSLLSSLGGVFNMFLGVGLFSALEIVFLIIVKIPLTIRRSAEFKKEYG